MLRKNRFLMRVLLISLLSWLILTAAQAASPLWIILPAPGSNPTQTVPVNSTAIVQYLVQNQSNKPKHLVIQSTRGITQTAPCQLAPKGQAGSQCTLNLLINGRTLPRNGIHGGPSLCQVNPDGSPNRNQCYQPSPGNSLQITRGQAMRTLIEVNSPVVSFVAGSNGVITVTNHIMSPAPATNVTAKIPAASSISVQNTTCGASLASGASCTITLTSPVATGPTNIIIKGTNTNAAVVAVTVTSTPLALLSVSPANLIFAQNSTGVVTVNNRTSSPVAALNVAATIPGASNISVQSTTCGASLAIGASCTITLTSNVQEGPTAIAIAGANTNTVSVSATVTPEPQITIINPVQQNRVVAVG